MRLRRRLYLGIFLVAVVPAALVVGFHSITYLHNSEATAETHTRNLVSGTVKFIDELLQNTARDVHGFALSDLTRATTPQAISQRLQSYTYAYPYFSEILWVSPQGTIIASSNPTQRGRLLAVGHAELVDEFNKVVQQPAGLLHVNDFDDIAPNARAERARQKTLSLHLLLRVNDANSSILGVLVAAITTPAIVTLLDDLQRQMPDARSVELLNQRGEILMSSLPQTALLSPHPFAPFIAKAMQTSSQAPQQMEIESGDDIWEVAVAATHGISAAHNATWYLVTAQSETIIRAPIRSVLLQTFGLFMAILIASWCLSLWMAHSVIKPIEALLTTTTRLGHGDLTARAAEVKDDETADLARAFNSMATALEQERGSLAQVNTTLEARVHERSVAINALEARNQQGRLLTEMSGMLQSTHTLDEAMLILPRFLTTIFAPHSGALYMIKSSLNYLDLLMSWGEEPLASNFEITACWGLRRGQLHVVEPSGNPLVCAHVSEQRGTQPYVCAPMMAQGTTLGVLHVAYASLSAPQDAVHGRTELVALVTEQLALALSNLRLRDTLREQSIRDSLTRLHNRRFLEESMARELANAQRERYQLAVFMLDVDHFKRFNDQHSHEAGDTVLRALGRTLRESVRAGDLACRFGGEEFTLVLLHMDAVQARVWAERLLERVRTMEVRWNSKLLPQITISLGLALYPGHEASTETLLQAADLALYDAKRAGRDRLVVSGDAETSTPPT